MRFNDTNNHQIQGANGQYRYVRATNVTASAVVIRVHNVPDAGKTTIDIATVDQDNSIEYGYSVPANKSRMWPINPQFPLIVYNGTANAINWSMA